MFRSTVRARVSLRVVCACAGGRWWVRPSPSTRVQVWSNSRSPCAGRACSLSVRACTHSPRTRLIRHAVGLQCIKTWGRPSTFLADIIKGLDRRQARSILIKKLDMTSGPHESPPYWKYRDALVFSHAVSPARPQCLTGRSAAAAETNTPTATRIGRVKARVVSWSHTDDGSVQSFLAHPAYLRHCIAACRPVPRHVADTGGIWVATC